MIEADLDERDLIRKRIDDHVMLLDRKDAGISKTLLRASRHKKVNREPAFTEILQNEIEEGMVAVDLGANIGLATLIMAARVKGRGKVYALEPDRRNFAILSKNIELNDYAAFVSAYRAAVSNVNGTVDFYLSDSSNLHSLYASRQTKVCQKVQAVTLDKFCEDKPYPNFIKMDIEGGEVEALDGAYAVLADAPSPLRLLIEVHPTYYSGVRDFEPRLRKLINIGFGTKYVISAGVAQPEFFRKRGYKPERTFRTGSWTRGLYTNVSNDHMIEACCGQHNQIITLPMRSIIRNPRRLLHRTISTGKIVRAIMLEK